jgi:hypothetical protein
MASGPALVQAAPALPADDPFASVSRRSFAWIADVVLVTVLVFVDALFATAVSAAYFVLPWALLGGSPAQLALRLRVRGDAGGGALPVGRALARWILLFPPFATVSALAAGVPLVGWLVWAGALAWYLVLFLTTAWSETNQGLHDRLAGSVVHKSRAAAG